MTLHNPQVNTNLPDTFDDLSKGVNDQNNHFSTPFHYVPMKQNPIITPLSPSSVTSRRPSLLSIQTPVMLPTDQQTNTDTSMSSYKYSEPASASVTHNLGLNRSPPMSSETSPFMTEANRRASLPTLFFSSSQSNNYTTNEPASSISILSNPLNMINVAASLSNPLYVFDEQTSSPTVPQSHLSFHISGNHTNVVDSESETIQFRDLNQEDAAANMDHLLGQELDEIYPSPAVTNIPRGDNCTAATSAMLTNSVLSHNPFSVPQEEIQESFTTNPFSVPQEEIQESMTTEVSNINDPTTSTVIPESANPLPRLSGKSRTEYPCPRCSKVFQRNHNLKSHMLTHSDDKPFKCIKCDMSFRRNHDLRRHYRLHTGVKPYICQRCDKRFSRSDALRRHIKVEACVSGVILPLTTPSARMVANMSSVAAAAAASATAAIQQHGGIYDGIAHQQQQLTRQQHQIPTLYTSFNLNGGDNATPSSSSAQSALMADPQRRMSLLMNTNGYMSSNSSVYDSAGNSFRSQYSASPVLGTSPFSQQQQYYPPTSLVPGSNPQSIPSTSNAYMRRTPEPPMHVHSMQTSFPQYSGYNEQYPQYSNFMQQQNSDYGNGPPVYHNV